jgi:hypothetical protein
MFFIYIMKRKNVDVTLLYKNIELQHSTTKISIKCIKKLVQRKCYNCNKNYIIMRGYTIEAKVYFIYQVGIKLYNI